MKPLSREFLLNRGFCCHNGCLNCPYMEEKKATKQDLIEMVIQQIVMDVHFKDSEAIEELLDFVPVENLIAYLPEEDWKPFNHLVVEEYLEKEEDTEEIRTVNALKNLIKQHHNDTDLGNEIRKRFK